MVDNLRNKIEKAIGGIDELNAGPSVDLDDLHTCLCCVEHQTDTSREEHLAVRARDDERLTVDAGLTQPEIVESGHA